MKHEKILVWFRNDLRVHDHAVLSAAIEKGVKVVPVYCFDPRMFRKSKLGLSKTGEFRATFLLEAVDNLRKNLRNLGADLVMLHGLPEKEVIDFAISIKATGIFFSEEVTLEEKQVEEDLEQHAWKNGIATESFWQNTLYNLQDLPFPVTQTPEVFTHFRKDCEKLSQIRKTIPTPNTIPYPKMEIEMGDLPDLSTFGLRRIAKSRNGVLDFMGGEDEGKKRLQTYFWDKDCLKVYKETRNGLLGADYSSKFSPWLALGCISPRYIFEEVLRYEREVKKNQSTYWLVFELIWRDYFRFICKKHGSKVFKLSGIKNHVDSWSEDEQIFASWTDGRTGIPFVDANMRELNQTGFMSNRGRQIVASFLVNDLGVNWTWGAAYFERMLIDYDVCSNWGNWMYVAGVGNDPRENRYFNILRQATNYDPKGRYVRHWIPELEKIEGFDIHQPFEMSTRELKQLGINPGHTYPHPVVKIPVV